MASVNKVILIGNLGRDPELHTFPDGGQLANAVLATTDKWKDKVSGEFHEVTEWHTVVFNGRLAEIASQYLRKGDRVYVEGSLRTRKWLDKKTGQDRYTTEIRAENMQMLGSKKDGASEVISGSEKTQINTPPVTRKADSSEKRMLPLAQDDDPPF